MATKWILALLVGHDVWAQNIDHEKSTTLSASLGIKHAQLSLMAEQPYLKYQPNVGATTFVAAAYRRYSFSLGIDQAPAEYSSQTHGQTKYQDYQVRFHGDRWSPELIYQSYQGYYLENSIDNSAVKYLRPDIKFKRWGAQLYYNFNPEAYSFSGHFSLRSRQLESSGAFFAVASHNFYHLQGEKPLVPENSSGGSFAEINEMRMHSTAVGVAGAYNFVYHNYFAGGLLGFGLNYQFSEARGLNVDSASYDQVGLKTFIKLGVGYNGELFYSGFSFNYDGQSSNLAGARVTLDSSEIKLFLGWRFEDMRISWIDKVDRQVAGYLPGP